MDQFEISELADWLEANHDALLAKTTLLPEAKVAAALITSRCWRTRRQII